MRWLLILPIPVCLFGQGLEVTPRSLRQGETIQVRSAVPAKSARMNGRVVPAFQQPEGGWLALMPVPVEEKPGRYRLEVLGENGAVLGSEEVAVTDARFPRQNIVISREKKELKPSPGEMEAVAALRKAVTPVRHWAEPFGKPVAGCMNSPFGVQRWHNGKPTGSYHRGVDQRSPAGTPIRAAAAGVVKIARMFNVHGGTVGIDHGQGVTSIYIHQSKVAAAEGGAVEKGDIIGYVGTTGFSTGPHLHWGVHVNGVAVSPVQWVKLTPCQAAAPKGTKKKRK